MRIIRNIIKFIPQFENLKDCWKINWLENEYYVEHKTIRKVLYGAANFFLLIGILVVSGLFPIRNFKEVLQCLVMSMFIGLMNGLAVSQDRENDDIN